MSLSLAHRTTGELITASIWNTDIVDPLNDHDSRIALLEAATVLAECRAIRGSAQSIPNAAATAITLPDAETYDTAAMHSTSVNPSRVTVTVDGYYLVIARCKWAGGGTGERDLWIQRSDAVTFNANVREAAAIPVTQEAADVVYLTAGQYVEAFGYQDSGGALDVAEASLTVCAQRTS